jgi:excisionase family DNA binding protein
MSQVARILEISNRTARDWAERQEIPAFKIGPSEKEWRVRESALREYLRKKEGGERSSPMPG